MATLFYRDNFILAYLYKSKTRNGVKAVTNLILTKLEFSFSPKRIVYRYFI